MANATLTAGQIISLGDGKLTCDMEDSEYKALTVRKWVKSISEQVGEYPIIGLSGIS